MAVAIAPHGFKACALGRQLRGPGDAAQPGAAYNARRTWGGGGKPAPFCPRIGRLGAGGQRQQQRREEQAAHQWYFRSSPTSLPCTCTRSGPKMRVS